MPAYLTTLSEFIAGCAWADLPTAVIGRAKLVVADSIAAIAGGSKEPEAAALTAAMLGAASSGPATVIGPGARTEPAKAAFLNGTAGTFLEMDEGNQFARGHPGIHVVPAALAEAEARGASGSDFLVAVVLGYEIGARIGIASKLRMSMHPHGTWGTVGAAVSVAKLRGWDAGQIAEVVNVASTLGLATSRQTMLQGGTVRNSYAGVSNQFGILACDMVAAGFTGERDGLATVYGAVVSESFEPDEMTNELGLRWEIARNYFKRHSCCRYNHGALDALAMIAGERPGGLKAEDIDKVEVETYSLAAQLSDPNPKNTLAGKFSLPFAVASTIVNGSSGLMSFTWEAIRNEAIQALADRVEVREDPALTAMMPAYRPARVRVTLIDGAVLEAETRTNRGDSEDPYSADELEDKFHELAGRVWPEAQVRAGHAAIMAIEAIDDINSLTGALTGRLAGTADRADQSSAG